MDVKTFEAYSMRDAIKLVKSEFGKDAVILETTEKRHSDSNRMMYLVTASAANRKSATARSGDSDTISDYIFDLQKQISTLTRTVNDISSKVVLKGDIGHLERVIEEVKHLYLSKEKTEDLLDVDNKDIIAIVNQLKLMQVDSTIINDLVTYLQKKAIQEEHDNATLSEAVKWCLKRIKISPKLMSQHSKEVHCFFGPTGSGKTTMVAKLASHYQKYNTLIVSMDDKKVGGSDQMRVFAKLLNVDFRVFADTTSLKKFIDKNESYELILIDLPGTDLKNKSSVASLSSLTEHQSIFSHLILPVTERKIQLENNIRHYSQLGINSLIFTKLDESWKYGDIFNLSYSWGIPVSYFSSGRGIPEDVERATKERIIEKIFSI